MKKKKKISYINQREIKALKTKYSYLIYSISCPLLNEQSLNSSPSGTVYSFTLYILNPFTISSPSVNSALYSRWKLLEEDIKDDNGETLCMSTTERNTPDLILLMSKIPFIDNMMINL